MKLLITAAMVLAVGAPASAQPAGGMTNMPGMGSGQGASHAAMVTADGSGVVTAVDVRAGTVSIHHSPIAKLGWPAMTMSFKATPPSLLQAIKAGQTVTFTLMQMGSATTLTAIQPK